MKITTTVTRSSNDDRAVLVFIDTDFEPNGEAPGLRVFLNDEGIFSGIGLGTKYVGDCSSSSHVTFLDDLVYDRDRSIQMSTILQRAGDLVSEDGENEEYDRGIAELIVDISPDLTMDDAKDIALKRARAAARPAR